MTAADPIGIAIEIAREFGLNVAEPVSLRSTNNIVAWLKPSQVVAKAGAGRHPRLRIEFDVAQELSALGGPSVCCASEIPPAVYSRSGVDVTFWRYHPQVARASVSEQRIAAALSTLHGALQGISPGLRALLPSYLQQLDLVRGLLADDVALATLAQADRDLLTQIFNHLRSQLLLLAPPASHIVLHGCPHPYNVLLVDNEVRFIDFETTCTGPVEWDMAYIGSEAEGSYGRPLQAQLLWTCRQMASVATAVWCWSDVDRGDMREHAEWHLAHLRATFA